MPVSSVADGDGQLEASIRSVMHHVLGAEAGGLHDAAGDGRPRPLQQAPLVSRQPGVEARRSKPGRAARSRAHCTAALVKQRTAARRRRPGSDRGRTLERAARRVGALVGAQHGAGSKPVRCSSGSMSTSTSPVARISPAKRQAAAQQAGLAVGAAVGPLGEVQRDQRCSARQVALRARRRRRRWRSDQHVSAFGLVIRAPLLERRQVRIGSIAAHFMLSHR